MLFKLFDLVCFSTYGRRIIKNPNQWIIQLMNEIKIYRNILVLRSASKSACWLFIKCSQWSIICMDIPSFGPRAFHIKENPRIH